MPHRIAAALENININLIQYIRLYEHNVIVMEETITLTREALQFQKDLLKKVEE